MDTIALPKPRTESTLSLEETLRSRRSVRDFARDPLALAELAQLLWAAQGITGGKGERTAPSAGATFPIEIYAAVGEVEGVETGLYKYRPRGHELAKVAGADLRRDLARVSAQQEFIGTAPLVIVVAAVLARTRAEYGERAVRYVDIEVGAVVQNAALQAVSLGLVSVVVGAFRDRELSSILGLGPAESVLALLPVGRPK